MKASSGSGECPSVSLSVSIDAARVGPGRSKSSRPRPTFSPDSELCSRGAEGLIRTGRPGHQPRPGLALCGFPGVAQAKCPCFGLVDNHEGRVNQDQGTNERLEAARWPVALRRVVQTVGGGAVAAGRHAIKPSGPELGVNVQSLRRWRRQCASLACRARLNQAGLVISMIHRGDCQFSAVIESFGSRFQRVGPMPPVSGAVQCPSSKLECLEVFAIGSGSTASSNTNFLWTSNSTSNNRPTPHAARRMSTKPKQGHLQIFSRHSPAKLREPRNCFPRKL
jgi:hypothetical protein